MFDEPGPSQRRITVGTKDMIVPLDGVQVDTGSVRVSAAGAWMEMKATTLRWDVEPGDDLLQALRPHIHEKVKGLPSHHFALVEPMADGAGEFAGLRVTIIIPEKQA